MLQIFGIKRTHIICVGLSEQAQIIGDKILAAKAKKQVDK